KKYGNRRLYDTSNSRYVTLDELAEKIREGADVRVVDAVTDEDLTAASLTQILFEHQRVARSFSARFALELIRLGDGDRAEFLTTYAPFALELYRKMHGRRESAKADPRAGELVTNGATARELAELRREIKGLKRELRKKGKNR